MLRKFKMTKETYLIIYKLLYDALALCLGSLIVALIAEGALPGIISAHISLARIVIVIILLLGAIAWIGDKFEIVYDTPRIKRNKFLPFLILFSFLLIGNSMLHFALWENILITLITLLVFFLFYKQIFLSEK